MLEPAAAFDEELQEIEGESSSPEAWLQRSADHQLLTQALEILPPEFREVIVLRELENLSYKEIAYVTQTPMGTVMSRLARARKQMQHYLMQEMKEGVSP